MHLDKLNNILYKIKPKNNNNFLPIYIDDLNFILDRKKILSNINLSITSDEITVIMGPNGSGKSIFLKLLNGILEPTSGSISWNGNKQFSETSNITAIASIREIDSPNVNKNFFSM